jgi:predicted Zn-dependent protease
MKYRRIALAVATVAALTLAGTLPSHASRRARLRAHQIVAQDFNSSDIEAEIRFGRGVAARILGIYRLHTDPGLTQYVNLVGRGLAMHTRRTEIRYYFAVLDTDVVNAYAAPGGYVFVTRGALELVKSETELAGILAHEIAHVTERHIVEELGIRARSTGATAGLAALLGGAGGSARVAFTQAVESAVTILFENGYRASDELEADRIAVAILQSTGYDPGGLAEYLARIESLRRGWGEDRSSAYPATDERVTQLRDSGAVSVATQRINPALERRFRQHVQLP